MEENVVNKEIILVVIDPANDSPIALDRAIVTSKLKVIKPHLHLFFIVDDENTKLKAKNPNLHRRYEWIEELTQRLGNESLSYTLEFSWSLKWYKSILQAASDQNPDIIYIPDYSIGKNRSFFNNARWALLRQSRCPVMLVRPGASSVRKRILAAVNIQNKSSEYFELNTKILEKGLALAKLYNAEFFVVNSYTDNLNFPNRELIMKMTSLHSKNVHAEEGKPENVISNYAKEIGADIVIVGTRAKLGSSALMRGNISAKILKKLTQDIITFS